MSQLMLAERGAAPGNCHPGVHRHRGLHAPAHGLRSRYEAALADHRRLLRTAFSSHQGIEVNREAGAGQDLRVRLEPLDDHDEWVAAYEASLSPEQVAARGLNQSLWQD